ncbi:MAG TPA: MGMT family protein [Blastocatellia bacterium]|jgi:methylated-DNA-protein-cysteine methyltransferase-like protein|nr:MGMT family protein [Blastocatellia bacterium]
MARAKTESSGSEAASKGRRGKPVPDGYERVFEKIYGLVLKIPRGRVMTYGQIARLLDDRYSPRLVGWAMHVTPKDERNIPWHRVINSQGGISSGRVIIHEPNLQRWMLEAEGVVFDDRGRCDLATYQWSGRASKKTAVKKTDVKKTALKKGEEGKKPR